MSSKIEERKDFFNTCGECRINCCRDAKPPITLQREKIIEKYLQSHGIPIKNPFMHSEYTFPREDREGYCILYDRKTRKCMVHPVKPETCAAGPVTFDINIQTGKIEWYLKMEEICPLAGLMFRDKEMLEKHFKSAREDILRLVRELSPRALKAILKRDEPQTFKISEEDVEREILEKLQHSA